MSGVVAEGTDPARGRFYLTQGTTLIGVDPVTGHIVARASGSAVAGSAGMYAVRNGVALGLDQGPNGEAWGYDLGAQRVTWTATGLPWPHYFVDIGGIGGSAQPDGATVIVAACAHLAPNPAPSPSGSGDLPGASPSGTSPSTSSPASGASASPAATGSATATRPAAATASPQPSPSNTAPGCQDPELVAISR
jgi:hypothetical protein